MNSSASEVARDFSPFFRVYKLFDGDHPIPAGLEPTLGIESKVVVISSETCVSARIFVRTVDGPNRKLALIVHNHGGGFFAGSPFDSASYNFLSTMVTQANVVADSIGYSYCQHCLW